MATNERAVKVSGIEADATLRARVAKLMAEQLARLAVRPISGQAAFFDDNGPKGGPANRCALTIRLPYRPSVRVERSADTPRLAFDAAFVVLDRLLERYRERDRENKRHPKKYFAASRAQTGEKPRPAKRARRA
ncbi:MAG TPA: HPF/RaiA family ribosome-associated protein [Candidatus Nitrosotalea sp.]|jgi:ribosome-associated translation inhibitor RaiA|nr:HPF/RaiA family ribosome-associated protein [Candidatus Nitrosotalea sp.]